jgi:hypothetical protein
MRVLGGWDGHHEGSAGLGERRATFQEGECSAAGSITSDLAHTQQAILGSVGSRDSPFRWPNALGFDISFPLRNGKVGLALQRAGVTPHPTDGSRGLRTTAR